MTNTKLLKEKIKDTGMTVVAFSRKAGILRETLYNKLNGASEFTASEIYAVSSILNLSRDERDDIFFANDVE